MAVRIATTLAALTCGLALFGGRLDAATPPETPSSTAASPQWHPAELPPVAPVAAPPGNMGKEPPVAPQVPAAPAPPSLQEQAEIRRRLAAVESATPAANQGATPPAVTPAKPASKVSSASPTQAATPLDLTQVLHGDLVQVGVLRLINPYSYWALSLGPALIGNGLFVATDPQFATYQTNWSLALHAPLNLSAISLEGRKVVYGHLRVRREDWREASQYLQVVRFLTVGRAEDPFYLSISSLQPLSLGHDMLLDRYQGNLDINRSVTSGVLDVSNRYIGMQAVLNDLTLSNRLLGGLVFAKPLFWLESPLARSWSVGGEYMADLAAPRCIRSSRATNNCAHGAGNVAGSDPFTNRSLDQTFVRTDPTTGRYAVQTTTVHAAGVSTELKIYRDESLGDIKLYGTWHHFLNSGGGSGIAWGLLARLRNGSHWISAWRLRSEYRTFTDGFLPSYFDTTYEANKYEFGTGQPDYQITPTKYQAVFGDPDNGFKQRLLGRRHGYKLDLQWALYRGSRLNKLLGVGLGLRDSTGPNDSSMYLHFDLPAFHALQFFATYLHLNEATFSDLMKTANLQSPNSIILGGLRLRVLPILWLNISYARSFQVARTAGSEYHLGNSLVLDRAGRPVTTFSQDRLFQSATRVAVNLEFGWDFEP